ncbi:cation:dicarboxylase symporter family transporter [Candidatus Haliotispira prima]|uniref:Cation:dicarboxylase symporter family transporter n=1 Tax=Candidatus Haliotispira prima TaxID=3034016 RepID=A0ABY8MJ69_9SPIO|nr:cation:dicarboxylase symporter family transporter [Candidatus Haliotispira prima]
MMTRFLKNPVTVFVAIAVGVLWGLYFPKNARYFSQFSDIYLLLIYMTIVPILVSAIISSVGQFIQNPHFFRIASKTWKVLAVTMVFVGMLGLVVGMILKPGDLPEEESQYLSSYIGSQVDVLVLNLDEKNQKLTEEDSFFSVFLGELIPANLFSALAEGRTLSLAFISIIVGIAAGVHQLRQKNKSSQNALIALCDNVFSIFQIIISRVLVILPIALIFITGSLVAENGLGIFVATIRLIVTFYVVGIILLLLGSIALAVATKNSILHVLRVSMAPALLGFVTRNSVATIPSCIENMTQGLNMDERLAKLMVPLFLVLCRYGNLAYFAVVTIFSIQVYQIEFGLVEFVIVILSIILTSIATAGATGFATLSVISITFLPLGIPVETVLVILYAIDPIIDPIRTMLIVHTNFSTVGIIGGTRQAKLEKVKRKPIISG